MVGKERLLELLLLVESQRPRPIAPIPHSAHFIHSSLSEPGLSTQVTLPRSHPLVSIRLTHTESNRPSSAGHPTSSRLPLVLPSRSSRFTNLPDIPPFTPSSPAPDRPSYNTSVDVDSGAIRATDSPTAPESQVVSSSSQPNPSQPRGTVRRRSCSPPAVASHLDQASTIPGENPGRRRTKRTRIEQEQGRRAEDSEQIMVKDSTSPAVQNGESSVNTTQSSTSVAPSLAARVKRVNLPGEQMYPTPESSLTTTAAPISRHIERDVKGKGKDRLDPPHSNLSPSGLPHDHGPLPISREEYVRLLLQSLNDVGYTQAAQVLEAESGYVQEPSLATSFRQALLGGRWSEAIHLLRDLGVIDGEDCRPLRKNSNGTNEAGGSDQKGNSANPAPTVSLPAETAAPQHIVGWQRPPSNSAPGVNGRDRNVSQNSPGRRAIFMILRQKYLELVEAGQTVRALKVLRNEVAPVATSAAKLHALSG